MLHLVRTSSSILHLKLFMDLVYKSFNIHLSSFEFWFSSLLQKRHPWACQKKNLWHCHFAKYEGKNCAPKAWVKVKTHPHFWFVENDFLECKTQRPKFAPSGTKTPSGLEGYTWILIDWPTKWRAGWVVLIEVPRVFGDHSPPLILVMFLKWTVWAPLCDPCLMLAAQQLLSCDEIGSGSFSWKSPNFGLIRKLITGKQVVILNSPLISAYLFSPDALPEETT